MVYIVITTKNGSPVNAEIHSTKPKLSSNQKVFKAKLPGLNHEQLTIPFNEEFEGELPGQISIFGEVG